MRWSNQKIFSPPFILVFLSVLFLFHVTDSQSAWLKLFANGNAFTGKVVGVSDGDTISVMRGGQTVKVRLHGIDCPEKKQPYGTRAKRFTSDRAFRNEVTVYVKDTDRYGRIVGEVILPDGKNLNRELVGAGLAWWYRRYAPDDEWLKWLEAEARKAKRGLWADKNPMPPWEWWKMQRGRHRK